MRLLLRLGKVLAILVISILTFSCVIASMWIDDSAAIPLVESSQDSTSIRSAETSANVSALSADVMLANALLFERSFSGNEALGGFVRTMGASSGLSQRIQINRHNAELSAMTLSPWAEIDTEFDPGKTDYNITIPYDKTYVEITPGLSDENARLSFTVDGKNEGSVIYLRMGQSKTAVYTVTSQNGIIEKTYTLNVSRSMPTEKFKDLLLNLIPTATMSFEELVADDGTRDQPPDPATLPPSDTYLLEVDVVNQYVTVYVKDKNGQFTIPYRFMICSTGTASTPTPIGTFKMGSIKRRFGYFKKFDCYAQYWTNLRGGIYFHSIIYKRRSVKTLSVGSYKNLGTRASHGCIRLLPPDAKWIYENCAPGTAVVVTKSKPKDTLLPALLEPPAP